MSSWVKNVGGACVVYVIMAACSSDEARRQLTDAVQDDGGEAPAHDRIDAAPIVSSPFSQGGTSTAGIVPANGGSGGVPGLPHDTPGDAATDTAEPTPSLLDAALDVVTHPIGNAQAQSGTRIKTKWQTTEDGAKQFIGWFDSELGVDCGSAFAADDQWHCLPPTAGSETYFTDETCTQAVMAIPESPCTDADLPKYAGWVTAATSSCTYYQQHIAERDTVIPEPAALWQTGGEACAPANYVSCPSCTWYSTKPEMPPSAFAKVTVEIE